MGRSIAVTHSTDVGPSQSQTRRKRTTRNVNDLGPVTFGIEDGKKGSYHCNYCYKDISGRIRIKCVICSDFDLCVGCFSVGAEVHPHKSNHPYRVMDYLEFPLICADWNADEEMLLLEGLEIYGVGNWAKVAEHVGTKSKSQCNDHYNTIYMNSPCFPLPDMSHVMGKNKEELLAEVRQQGEIKKGATASGEIGVKEEPLFSATIKEEKQGKERAAGLSSSNIFSEFGPVRGSRCGKMSTGAGKSTSNEAPSNDGLHPIAVEDFHDGSIRERKTRMSGDEKVSMEELCGYNSKRQEFEIEYDNDAEQFLADMEFKETDTETEHLFKLRLLHIYSNSLDERKWRKDFILDRKLLHPDPFEKDLTLEEKELCQSFRVLMRFHSKEEHYELLRNAIEEHRILKRIQDLQEARAASCHTSAEAERFIEQKRKREIEVNALRGKESSQGGPSGKFWLRVNHHCKGENDTSSQGRIRSPAILDSGAKESSSLTTEPLAGFGVSDKWDITGFLGADTLSEAEQKLCEEIRILPIHYLKMVQTLTTEISNGNLTRKSDAHGLDPWKIDKVYDMLSSKGIVPKHD